MAKKAKKALKFELMVMTEFPCGDNLYATKEGIYLNDNPNDGYGPNFTWTDVDAFLKEASKLRPAKKGA